MTELNFVFKKNVAGEFKAICDFTELTTKSKSIHQLIKSVLYKIEREFTSNSEIEDITVFDDNSDYKMTVLLRNNNTKH